MAPKARVAARHLRFHHFMKQLMADLVALQNLEFLKEAHAPEETKVIERLRKRVPGQILGHYDRLMIRGKRGVAAVRNGVCAECHIKVAIGALGSLMAGTDIQLCGNCGRYLY